MIRSAFLAAVSTVVLGSAAMAADLPSDKGPPAYAPPPLAFSWTGFYLGAQAGYEWGSTRDPFVSVPGFGTFPLSGYNDNGIVGGAHGGYNFQISQFVLGVEGDIDGADYHGAGSAPFLLGPTITESTRIGLQGSVRGRLGFAFDRFLVYGTGGVAVASIDNALSFAVGPGVNFSAGNNYTRAGWTAGGGVEYAIDNNWSARAEYRYSDYGRVNYSLDSLGVFPTGSFVSKHVTTNMATAGFSYKFGDVPPPAPVVSKY